MFAAVVNIGCRLNQSEGDSLRRYLRNQGYELVAARDAEHLTGSMTSVETRMTNDKGGTERRCDLVIVNTCCVTREAERSSLNRIRRIAGLTPKPRLVVTGCMAELAPGRLREIPGVDQVLGIEEKERLVAGNEVLPGRSRAFLRVQDGCYNRCAYCVVSTLRGRLTSKPIEQVKQEAEQLAKSGFREIVLVGLNLGMYGTDSRSSLAELLDRLACELTPTLMPRLRLSSIEPETVTGELMAAMVRLSRTGLLCPHFHTPLQSGDDRILRMMNRRYTAAQFRALVGKITEQMPDANVGTDVIVGFPGEDEAAYESTRRLIEELPLGYLHVFSYSPRPGTAAFELKETVDRRTRKERVAELRELGAARARAFRRRFAGTIRPAIVIRPGVALTDNYITVAIGQNSEAAPGQLIDAVIAD